MSLPIKSILPRNAEPGNAAAVHPRASPKSPSLHSAIDKPASADSPATAPAERAELEKALDAANRKLADDGREVRFEFDRDASKVVVRLIDTSTQEVLRQFPSNEALRMARLANAGKPLLTIRA